MKTVLAPGAPWPNPKEEKPKQTRAPRQPKKRSTQQNTDEKFNLWALKHVGGMQ
jgi:hypothetical protein